MSMLDRYRKPGGFVQLLALIETCNQAKQEKLLEIIAQEDSRWSETVRAKMLTIDRIYSWNDNAIAEIFGSLQDLTVAVALHAAQPEFKSRVVSFFAHGRLRKIEDLLDSKGPSPAEISATHMKIVESVRKMGSDGFLRFEAIDSNLVIDDDIEDSLAHAPAPFTPRVVGPQSAATATPSRVLHSYSHISDHVAAKNDADGSGAAPGSSHAHSSAEANESRLVELQNLKKRVAEMSKENAVLRHDLSIAKSKLDQIKKIA